MSRIPRVLSIAGTDPTGGAGLHADLKSISANGGYGMAVVTSLVAQNTRGVRSIHQPPTSFLREQLEAVSDDVAIDAVKIGMLATREVVTAVGVWLRQVRPPIVVLDPVMVATSGDRLLDRGAEAAVRALLADVDIVTPNLPELAVLAEGSLAGTWPEAIEQARAVSARHAVIVLVKGGHLGGNASPDALVDAARRLSGDRDVVEFEADRVATANTHGTGCSLSSALATWQARLGDWEGALAGAKSWLTDSLRHADELEVGQGNGPIHHFAALWRAAGAGVPAPGLPAPVPGPARLTDRWWDASADVRAGIDILPFVRALGDGTLAEDSFSTYLAQDALYLRGYSRALARASQLAPTTREQAFWASSAHGCLAEELELHRTWLRGREPVTEPSPVTTAYLNHLLAAAQGGSYAVLVAAVLPCFWIYQDVGERLNAANHAAHPYRVWLDCYAQPEFAALTVEAIEIVERAGAIAVRPERDEMGRAFHASVEHERAFFAQST